jgi:hypothetical protein
MQWGFKSAWSQQPLINAKAETIRHYRVTTIETMGSTVAAR